MERTPTAIPVAGRKAIVINARAFMAALSRPAAFAIIRLESAIRWLILFARCAN